MKLQVMLNANKQIQLTDLSAVGMSIQRESQQLPSPAQVIKELHNLKVEPHEHVTSFLGVWGHMVLKDLASTLNSGGLI
jgi:hypothetical protein